MKPKPWQIGLIVLGLLVGTGSVVYSIVTTQSVPITNVTHCIDVETGELYRIDFPVILPAKNPTSGRRSLIRVRQEGGKWFASGRDLETLRLMDKGVVNKVVDEQSGDVKGDVKTALAYPKPR